MLSFLHRLLVQEMVKVHSIDPDEVMKQSQIPGPFMTRKPMVFDRCWKWLDLIPDEFSDAEKNKRSVVLTAPENIWGDQWSAVVCWGLNHIGSKKCVFFV